MGTIKTAQAEGVCATFNTPSRVPIDSCKVYFNPRQEGSGTPSPSNVREIVGLNALSVYCRGNNLFKISRSSGSTKTQADVTWTINNNGTITVTGTPTDYSGISFDAFEVPPTGSYILTGIPTDANVAWDTIAILDAEQQQIGSVAGGGYYNKTINFASYEGAKFLRITIKRNSNNVACKGTFKLYCEAAPAANEDYYGQNILINFPATGKNLFNIATVTKNTYIRASSPVGEIASTSQNYDLSTYISVLPNTEYTVNYNASSQATAAGMVFFSTPDNNGVLSGVSLSAQTHIDSSTTRNSYTFTTPANCYYIRLSTFPNASNIQLELGAVATSYEPFQNIYGGYIDLITGDFVQTWHYVKLNGSENWTTYDNTYRVVSLLNDIATDNTVRSQTISNIAVYNEYGSSTEPRFSITSSGTIYIRNAFTTLYPTLESFTTYLTSNPMVICYTLETPIHYSIPTTALSAYLRQNHIWSDADNVIVEYELTEPSYIRSARKRIMLNNPHIETATGSIAQFSTDMIAPLTEAIVPFFPRQAGSGIPSPTNERIIDIPTSLNLTHTGRNLFDPSQHLSGNVYTINNGLITISANDNGNWNNSAIMYLKAGTYTFSRTNSSGRWYYKTSEDDYDVQYQLMDDGIATSTLTFSHEVGLKFKLGNQASLFPVSTYVQIELGNTSTSYEPFNGNTHVVDLTTNANYPYLSGTFYGGEFDILTGEAKITWARCQIYKFATIQLRSRSDTVNMFTGSSLGFIVNPQNGTMLTDFNYQPVHGISNWLQYTTSEPSDPWYFSFTSAGWLRIYTDKTIDSTSSFLSYLDAHPLQLGVELNNPIPITLPPTTIKTFRNINNFYTNGREDNLMVKFWTH